MIAALLGSGTPAAAWDYVYGQPSTPTVTSLSAYSGVAVAPDGATYLAGAFTGDFAGISTTFPEVSGFVQKVETDGTTAWSIKLGSGFLTPAGIEPGGRRVAIDPDGNIFIASINHVWSVSSNGSILADTELPTMTEVGGVAGLGRYFEPHPDGGFVVALAGTGCDDHIPMQLRRYDADLIPIWTYDLAEIFADSENRCAGIPQIVPVSDGSTWAINYYPMPVVWDPGRAATAMVHVDSDGSKIASILHNDYTPTMMAWASDTTLWLDTNEPIPTGGTYKRLALSADDGHILGSTPMTYPAPGDVVPGTGQVCNYFEPMQWRATMSADRMIAEGRCYFTNGTTIANILGHTVITYAVDDAFGSLQAVAWNHLPGTTTIRDFDAGPYGDVVMVGSMSTSGAFFRLASTAGIRPQTAPVQIAAAVQNPNGSLWRGRRLAGSILELRVTGRNGIPDDAAAVVMNVTVTQPAEQGYLTVFPCGEDRPLASSLNFAAGQTVAGAVVAKVGRGGRVCIYSARNTHLITDINGFFPGSSGYVPLAPARLLETRPTGPTTVDGLFWKTGPVAEGGTVQLTVAGRGGVPSDASAVVLNLTGLNASLGGFVTAYPCGTLRPNASNLNLVPGRAVANTVVAKVGSDGKVCLYSSRSANLLADVSGYFPGTEEIAPLAPARLMETRSTGASTIDGLFWKGGAIQPSSVAQLTVAGRGGVPADAGAAVLNVTVTGATSNGYLTLYPCGTTRPTASTLNFAAGVTVANAALAKIGTAGRVCIYASAPVHVIIDVNAHFPTSTNYEAQSPSRALDTR